MKTQVLCKELERGRLTFYALVDGKEYFLFQQDYKSSVNNYFCSGVTVDKVNSYSQAHSHVVRKVLDKLPSYLHYIEKEYGVDIYNKTKQAKSVKNHKAYKRESFKWQDYAFAM